MLANGQSGKLRRPVYAHRVSWELAYGPIPAGLEVLHRCDVPLCVRPDHLFIGTQQENLTDARQKGRLDETRPRTTSKLTPAERMAIFEAKGYRGIQAEFARRYGVTKACIHQIRKGRFKRPVGEETPFDRLFERVPHVQLRILGELNGSSPCNSKASSAALESN